jgi:hypothetical protein
MRIASVVSILIVPGLLGCSDDSGAPPDSRAPKDVSQPKDLASSDQAPAGDVGPLPDGKPKVDTPALVDAAPKPDAAPKIDGAPKPDTAKPLDAAKAPDAKKPDAAPTLDGGNACAPNPCQHGGTCTSTSGGPSCTCTAGWKGTICQTATYCDVLYRLTGTFHTTNAPLIGQFSKTVGTNAALPPFSPTRTTPFTPAAFPSGYIRLRFPNGSGVPVAGPVSIVEYFMPMEFSVTTAGTTVNTNVDHSAGLLQLGGTPPKIGDPPALGRACAAVASGTLSGTTLTWSACSAVPTGAASWTFSNAVSGDAGCLHRMSVWGNVNCTAGFCSFVSGLGNQRETWDQMLQPFTFSGTNLATATFTMAEVQTPNSTNVNTYIAFAATSVVKVECDTTSPITCDEQ